MNNTFSKNIALEASLRDDVLYFSTYDFPRFVRVIAFQDESDFMGEWDKSQSRDVFVFQLTRVFLRARWPSRIIFALSASTHVSRVCKRIKASVFWVILHLPPLRPALRHMHELRPSLRQFPEAVKSQSASLSDMSAGTRLIWSFPLFFLPAQFLLVSTSL